MELWDAGRDRWGRGGTGGTGGTESRPPGTSCDGLGTGVRWFWGWFGDGHIPLTSATISALLLAPGVYSAAFSLLAKRAADAGCAGVVMTAAAGPPTPPPFISPKGGAILMSSRWLWFFWFYPQAASGALARMDIYPLYI